MSRFSGAATTEVAKQVVRPALLVNIFGEYWAQNDAPVTWNGHTYTSAAFSIQGVPETTNTDTRMLNIGLPATTENIARRDVAHVWQDMSVTMVFLDTTTGVVVSGISTQTYLGKIVSINITHDEDNPLVQVVCQDIMSLMDRVAGLRFNTLDQKSRPGASADTIFDALPKLQGREVRWLQKIANAGTVSGGGAGGSSSNRIRVKQR